MANSPGTVSKILWHFTGGPIWNEVEGRQEKKRKSDAKAYKALCSILKSHELRVGSYQEVVKVVLPVVRRWDSVGRRTVAERDVPREFRSVRVCCLADIPVMHIGYHAKRYGKFALGFHRESAIRQGFSPVFYQLHKSAILASIYTGFEVLEDAMRLDVMPNLEYVESRQQDVEDDLKAEFTELFGHLDVYRHFVIESNNSFRNLLAFVKTFPEEDFGTIYTEREWRSKTPWDFNYSDLAMIVIPKSLGRSCYYNRFINRFLPGIPELKTVPVVPWEDLIEH